MSSKVSRIKRFLLIASMLAIVAPLCGCNSDGNNGAAGAPGLSAYELAVDNGFTGTEAEWLASLEAVQAAQAIPESCAVCHDDIKTQHAATNVPTVGALASDDATGDLVITFNVAVDGVSSDAYTLRRGYVNYDDPANPLLDPLVTYKTTFVRDSITADVVFSADGGGDYTITVPAAEIVADSTYLFQLENAADGTRPVVIVQYGAAHLRDLVSQEGGCGSCHGDYPALSEKFNHYAVGGNDCQICHSQYSRSTTFISKNAAGAFVEAGSFLGTNLTEYIHGIHSSHNRPDGVYYRTTVSDAEYTTEDRYSIGYPSDMRNCNKCHVTDAQLAAAANAPVSGYLCFSCHESWDGFVRLHDGPDVAPADGEPDYEAGDFIFAATSFHRDFPVTYNCQNCHTDGFKDTAASFHTDFQDDAHYNSFYGGKDISFANPNEVSFTVTGVTKVDDAVTFTWTASNAGGAVNPCNTDINAGPTFQDLRAYLAYAKGDDWVNDGVGTAPGQPLSALKLFTSLTTTCAANVATTTGLTVSPAATYAEKALLAIGGKPLDMHADAGEAFFVRVPSPNYTFSMANGAAATPRRDAVDSTKCTGCHAGTLYQHGGDRVDNDELCVICHNPASNDKNNRLTKFQIVNADGTVDTDSTYDGKTGQTYDLRTMIHSIHGVGKEGTPWVIYRSRGIYSFVPPVYEEIDGDLFERAYPKPTGWPADGQTIYGSDNGSTIAHNWIVVHYPKPVSDCQACHNDEAYEAPDQTKAVAVTQDAGTDWTDQSDDLVIGPAAAACTACHNTASVRSHAEIFGYKAVVTKDAMLEMSN
jgi:OmcA/MtrC family decaheme c-type cytochrome